MPLPLLLLHAALAAGPGLQQLPFRSVAGEDGAHTLFLNPSLLNFDRDSNRGVFFQSDDSGSLSALSFAATGGGLGTGLSWQTLGADGLSWWTLHSAVSLRIAPEVTFGTAINWQLPDGESNNFVSWDLGAAWRPTPWFGLGLTGENLGSPAPDLGMISRYKVGLAFRPFGDVLTASLDGSVQTPTDADPITRAGASLRARPVRGLWLRAYGDTNLADTSDIQVGGAVELHFGTVGVGGGAASSADGLGLGGYVTTAPEEDQLFLPVNRVASFTLDSAYPYQPTSSFFSASTSESYLSLLRRLEEASRDPNIKGVLLNLDATPFSFAQIEELRSLIKKARDNRKPVIAFLSQSTSNAAYLLATACDKVYLHPAADLDLVGMSAELQYFQGALQLVGVEAQYAKRAEYKSAPEQWTRTSGSDPAREEMNALLDDLYGVLVDGIARGRGKTPEQIKELIDNGPYTAKEALAAGLVDGLVYPDELEAELEKNFDKDFWMVDDYRTRPDNSGWEPNRAIAVIVIDGAIADGYSSQGGFLGGSSTGSRTIVKMLEQAKDSDYVRAVVLRVDSPGGSAFASDEIWRAVEKVKEAGKPVVISMGGYAASGGYYVSAGGTEIFALPSTVTGSIGVYGGKFSAGELFDRLQIHTEQYNRGRNASMYSLTTPFDPVQYAALDRMIDDTYQQFKSRVETGRNLSPEQVEAVARGRVWSGARAKEQGLVDQLGGFYEAVAEAQKEADLRDGQFMLITYDPWLGDGESFPAYVVRALQPKIELPPELAGLGTWAALRDERIFALMPYQVTFH